MKRYEVVDHNYFDGYYITPTMEESLDGEWVPASVAQALYDALLNLKEVEESELVGVAWKNARNRAVKRAHKALSLADEEE